MECGGGRLCEEGGGGHEFVARGVIGGVEGGVVEMGPARMFEAVGMGMELVCDLLVRMEVYSRKDKVDCYE